jgi:hypothetical protein
VGEFAKEFDFENIPLPKKDKRDIRERVKEMNESGLYSQPVTADILRDMDRKQFMYRLHEFRPDDLSKMEQRIHLESTVIGGLTKHHSEALTKKGWLLPFLLGYDQLFWKRWDYWFDIIEAGTIDGSGPIPQIEWCGNTSMTDQVRKMLFHCMDGIAYEGVSVEQFADWLLWGFGAVSEPPKISEKVNEHWYQTFDLSLVLKYPTDYMSRLLEELSGRGYKDALGYFATPYQVAILMTQMAFVESDNPEEMKRKKFYDPCVGCGSLMLPASNYTLFASAQDISSIAVKLCTIQMYWYAPWFAMNPL